MCGLVSRVPVPPLPAAPLAGSPERAGAGVPAGGGSSAQWTGGRGGGGSGTARDWGCSALYRAPGHAQSRVGVAPTHRQGPAPSPA